MGRHHCGNYVRLVALHEAYGSPAELEPVRSDPRTPKGNARMREQRMISV